MNTIKRKPSSPYKPRWDIYGPDGALLGEVVGKSILYSTGEQGLRYYVEGRKQAFGSPRAAAQSLV